MAPPELRPEVGIPSARGLVLLGAVTRGARDDEIVNAVSPAKGSGRHVVEVQGGFVRAAVDAPMTIALEDPSSATLPEALRGALATGASVVAGSAWGHGIGSGWATRAAREPTGSNGSDGLKRSTTSARPLASTTTAAKGPAMRATSSINGGVSKKFPIDSAHASDSCFCRSVVRLITCFPFSAQGTRKAPRWRP